MGFSRQQYWSGLPYPSPGDLPDPEIEPMNPVSPALQADSLALSHRGIPRQVFGVMHNFTAAPRGVLEDTGSDRGHHTTLQWRRFEPKSPGFWPSS